MSDALFVTCGVCGNEATPEYCLEVEDAETGAWQLVCGSCVRRMPEEARLTARVVARLREAGGRGLSLRELSQRAGQPYPALVPTLDRLITEGKVLKRTPDGPARRGRPSVRYSYYEEPPF